MITYINKYFIMSVQTQKRETSLTMFRKVSFLKNSANNLLILLEVQIDLHSIFAEL